jgi:hypothetical protein
MTLFESVLSISTTKIHSDDRALLKLAIAGSSEVGNLLFSFYIKKFSLDFNTELSIGISS